MKKNKCINGYLVGLLMSAGLHAATPVWTYSAPNPAKVSVSDGETLTVQYILTNQSRKTKNLILKTTSGLSASPCYLAGKGSTCTLMLTINGSLIPHEGLLSGPILCELGNSHQCYQPDTAHVLQVKKNTSTAAIYRPV